MGFLLLPPTIERVRREVVHLAICGALDLVSPAAAGEPDSLSLGSECTEQGLLGAVVLVGGPPDVVSSLWGDGLVVSVAGQCLDRCGSCIHYRLLPQRSKALN